MTCKRALLFGALGGMLSGAALYVFTTSFDPDSFVYRGFELLHLPLSPLYTWLRGSLGSGSVDVDLIYFFAFPIYWTLVGLATGMVAWLLFRKRQTENAKQAV